MTSARVRSGAVDKANIPYGVPKRVMMATVYQRNVGWYIHFRWNGRRYRELAGKGITKSERKGATVIPRILEYLGRDPDPKRLKRALRYWGVKARTRKSTRRQR